jgi:shikimate dehydrogenase
MQFKEFIKSDISAKPHYLLLGNPVGHSVSPLMHNTALKHHKIDAEYVAVSVDMEDFDLLASHFNSEKFLGANITIPHKENLIPIVDELTVTAKAIGAINTIVKSNGLLTGDNTDAYGFMVPLNDIKELDPERAIIFGSGGATKAILHALNDFGFEEVCMVSRKSNLSVDQSNVIICTYDDWQHYSDDATLIINATPLGMAPNLDSSPIRDSEIECLAGKVCYDIVYNPRETKLLKQTKQAEGIPIGGLDMLVHQGDESFYKWTGKRFPLGLVKMKLDEHFAN